MKLILSQMYADFMPNSSNSSLCSIYANNMLQFRDTICKNMRDMQKICKKNMQKKYAQKICIICIICNIYIQYAKNIKNNDTICKRCKTQNMKKIRSLCRLYILLIHAKYAPGTLLKERRGHCSLGKMRFLLELVNVKTLSEGGGGGL